MNNKYFFTALAAVTLSLGFTACSDDDELKGNYELKGCINIQNTNIDSTEYKHIQEVYYKALGAGTDGNDFTIQGKDSLDCESKILQYCKKADEKLKGETWTGVYNAQVLVNNYKTIIYNQQYGKYADNVRNIYRKDFSQYWGAELTKNSFTTGFSVQNNGSTVPGQSMWALETFYADWMVNSDSSNQLYLCMQLSNYKLDDVKKMVQNDDSRLNQLVADVIVMYRDDWHYPKEFTYKGAKYEVCGGGTKGEKDPIDLNLRSGGPYMYLYVSHDVKHFNRVLDGYEAGLFACYGGNLFKKDTWGVRDETSELVTGVYQDKNGNLQDHYEEGIDFQKGTGSSEFIKLRLSYVPLDELKAE